MNKLAPGSAAALTSATSRGDAAAIYGAMKGATSSTSALRLVYVTPERVSKSKQLMAALEKTNDRQVYTKEGYTSALTRVSVINRRPPKIQQDLSELSEISFM